MFVGEVNACAHPHVSFVFFYTDSISHDSALQQNKKKKKKKEIWALHVLPSFLSTIRSCWLGCELRGEMESCFRNSAEEEHVYVAVDD